MGYEFGILGHGMMCSGNFVGLRSWIIDVIGVDCLLDRSHQRGSSRGREGEKETVRPKKERKKKIKTKKE